LWWLVEVAVAAQLPVLEVVAEAAPVVIALAPLNQLHLVRLIP
jgi:hypothetical protein